MKLNYSIATNTTGATQNQAAQTANTPRVWIKPALQRISLDEARGGGSGATDDGASGYMS